MAYLLRSTKPPNGVMDAKSPLGKWRRRLTDRWAPMNNLDLDSSDPPLTRRLPFPELDRRCKYRVAQRRSRCRGQSLLPYQRLPERPRISFPAFRS